MLKYVTFNEKDFIISKKLVGHTNTESHGKRVDQNKQFDLGFFIFFFISECLPCGSFAVRTPSQSQSAV